MSTKPLMPCETIITHGDWQLTVYYDAGYYGFRRYHKHGSIWKPVNADYPEYSFAAATFVCMYCGEPVPEEMEGYINLVQWKNDKVE